MAGSMESFLWYVLVFAFAGSVGGVLLSLATVGMTRYVRSRRRGVHRD